MSYCRWGKDSDVYVYGTRAFNIDHKRLETLWVCQDCELKGDNTRGVTTTATAMISHLLAHREAGHKVPEYAIERLRDEENEPLT